MFAKVFVFVVLLSIIQTKADDIAFVKLGSYGDASGSMKEYYLSRHFRTFWIHTRSICKAYGMDVVSLETRDEQNVFMNLCQEKKSFFDGWAHVGGMTIVGINPWYWVNSGKRIEYSISFEANEPNNYRGREFCLAIGKRAHGFVFNDVTCYGPDHEHRFICQKVQEKDNYVNETPPQP